jgi:transcription elongation factor Elf1
MRTLTYSEKQEYIESAGTKCPFCKSEHLNCSRIEVDAGGASQDIICENCGASWSDLYTLTEIINVE